MVMGIDYTLLVVAVGSAILGGVTGMMGVFAVLRRQSLVGDAIAHAALPGIVLGFLLSGRDMGPLVIGATLTGWLAAMLISVIVSTTKIKQDTAIGISLMAFFALGIVGLTHLQSIGSSAVAGIDEYIFGQAATMVQADVQLIAGLGLAIVTIMVVFWKEMKLVTFDPDFARANGYPLRWLEMLISSLLVVGLVMGLRVAGAILMLGVLVAPAVAARQWTNRLSIMVILAGIFGAVSGASGAVISGWDAAFPTGPFIIVIAFTFAVVSIAIAPGRGLFWRWWRQFSDRYRFAAQQVMRDLYRAIPANRPEFAISTQKLIALSGPTAPIGLKRLERKGLIRRCEECELFQSGHCPGCWLFTDQGLMAAQSDARNQRLWDCYRCYAHDLGLPLIAEDRQCDITALLTEDAVLRLEQLSD